MKRNEQLRQDRAKLAADMNLLVDDFKAKATPTDAERSEFHEKFNRMDADQTRLKEDIDVIERAEAIAAETRTTGVSHEREIAVAGAADEKEQRKKAHAAAFDHYLRFGVRDMSAEHRNILMGHRSLEQAMIPGFGVQERATLASEGTPTGGAYPTSTSGFFVPVDFSYEIETAMKWYGSMLDAARIFTTSTGAPLPFPTVNDTTVSATLLAENAQVSAANINVSQVVLGSYKYTTGLVLVSIELLQDSAFDLNAYIKEQFAIRMGRGLNTAFTTGAGGGSAPTGIVGASSQFQFGGSNYTFVGAASNDGSSGANTIGTDDLLVAQHSVDRAYRQGASYMMNDLTLASMRKLKDKYGRPLWQVSVSSGAPDTIDGRPYFVNNDMDAIQTAASSPTVTKKTLLFGDFKKYIIRRVKDMTILRLEERYADFGQVGFVGFARYDGNLIDAGTKPVQFGQNVY